MELIEYDARYRDDFIRFNKDWIIDNFGFLDKEDIETFEKIDEELANGAKRLFMLSNSSLKAAMHIYEKYGFKEIKLDDYAYVRGNIAFEKWV